MAQFYSANRRVATRETVTVLCDQLDAFGQGLARHRGKVMFIPGLLPGSRPRCVSPRISANTAAAKWSAA
ncbi:hypothetical protein SODG_007326 [Sodalis praecaptivus]